MKKLISLISVLIIGVSLLAQSLTPRFGSPPRDNTGRVLTYSYVPIIDTFTVQKDTISLNLKSWETIVKISVVSDSTHTCFTVPNYTNSYLGDVCKVILSGTNVLTKAGTSDSLKRGVSFVMDSVKQITYLAGLYSKKAATLGQDSAISKYVKSPWILTSKYISLGFKNKAMVTFIFDGTKWIETGRLRE
jgi:hypothetical protein